MTTNVQPPSNRPNLIRFLLRTREQNRFGLTDFITYLYLFVGVFVMFGPVIWLVMSSFKDETLIKSGDPTFLPYRQVSADVEGYEEPLLLWDVTFKDHQFNNHEPVEADIRAANGVIHIMDDVLVPVDVASQINSLSATGGAVEDIPASELDGRSPIDLTLFGTEQTTIFAQLVAASTFSDYFAEDGAYPEVPEQYASFEDEPPVDTYTVFAPTNEALLSAFGTDTLGSLLQADNQPLLDEFIASLTTLDSFNLPKTNRLRDPNIPTLNSDHSIEVSLTEGETRRLAVTGAPVGSSFPMVDPDQPDEEFNVIILNTLYGDVTVEREPIREVHFSIDNYTEGVETFDFLTYVKNSTIVTIVATLITLLVNSMAAYGLSKYKFFGRDAIFVIIISTLMVPVSVIIVPALVVISKVGWVNNLWGLIIPGAATPTGVFLLRQYMLTIPDELLDAARIDGASEWRIFWQVIMPLARPALAVLAIFSIMWRWNDFLWPLVVVSGNSELHTLPVALRAFQGALDSQEHLILAMTVLTLLPITLIFAFLQQYITSGIATTGMK